MESLVTWQGGIPRRSRQVGKQSQTGFAWGPKASNLSQASTEPEATLLQVGTGTGSVAASTSLTLSLRGGDDR